MVDTQPSQTSQLQLWLRASGTSNLIHRQPGEIGGYIIAPGTAARRFNNAWTIITTINRSHIFTKSYQKKKVKNFTNNVNKKTISINSIAILLFNIIIVKVNNNYYSHGYSRHLTTWIDQLIVCTHDHFII